jgi:hypothetical protein
MPINKSERLKIQRKYNILESTVKIVDGFFIFFISLNVILLFTLLIQVKLQCPLCAGCSCLLEPLAANINNLRLGSIITITLTVLFYSVFRLPLSNKLKTYEFKLKYGTSEEHFKQFRENSREKYNSSNLYYRAH